MPQLFQLVAGVGNLISTIVILGYSTPIMLGESIQQPLSRALLMTRLAFVLPLTIIYWFVLRFYRKSLRELKRLESTGRGPLQSRISETLDGIPTIMAYGRETDFESAVGTLLDASNKPTFLRMHAGMSVLLALFKTSESPYRNLGHPSHGDHVFVDRLCPCHACTYQAGWQQHPIRPRVDLCVDSHVYHEPAPQECCQRRSGGPFKRYSLGSGLMCGL